MRSMFVLIHGHIGSTEDWFINHAQSMFTMRLLAKRFVFITRLQTRGRWAQANFVELWTVSRPRLDEMAIEIFIPKLYLRYG